MLPQHHVKNPRAKPRLSSSEWPAEDGNKAVSAHILPTSATLVGACITAISVVKFAHVGTAGAFLDRLLGVATCLFLVSAIASFASIRRAQWRRRLESAAESVFLVALALVTIAALGMAFELH